MMLPEQDHLCTSPNEESGPLASNAPLTRSRVRAGVGRWHDTQSLWWWPSRGHSLERARFQWAWGANPESVASVSGWPRSLFLRPRSRGASGLCLGVVSVSGSLETFAGHDSGEAWLGFGCWGMFKQESRVWEVLGFPRGLCHSPTPGTWVVVGPWSVCVVPLGLVFSCKPTLDCGPLDTLNLTDTGPQVGWGSGDRVMRLEWHRENLLVREDLVIRRGCHDPDLLAYVHTCILAYLHTCILTHLPTYPLTYFSCFPTYLPTHPLTYWHATLFTYVLTNIHTYILTFLPTNLLTFSPTHRLTYSHTRLLTYLPTCLLCNIPTYLLSYLPTHLPANPRIFRLTMPPEINSNDFGGFLELISRFEFEFCRRENYFFWRIRIFGVFMWMCCGLFVPTQFHFECCDFLDDWW